MESVEQKAKPWSNVQAYAMAVICLLVGIPVGYLLAGPGAAGTAPTQARPVPQQISASAMPPAVQTQGQEPADQALSSLLAELQQNPKDAALMTKVGTAYLSAKQFPTAKDYFERSLAIKADPVAYSGLAFAIFNMGDTENALATLNHGLQADPKDPVLLFNLGMLEWRGRTDPKAAIAAWEKLLKTNPNYPDRAAVERLIQRARLHVNLPPDATSNKPPL